MLLLENLLQPIGLSVSGNASERDSRLQTETSRRVPRRVMSAVLRRWSKPVFEI